MLPDITIAELFDEKTGKIKEKYYGQYCPGIGVGIVLISMGRFAHIPELGDADDGQIRFLLGRRGDLRSADNPNGVRSDPRRWDMPGGTREWRETTELTAKREAEEELGVKIWSLMPLFSIEHQPDDQDWFSRTFGILLDNDSPPPSVPENEREKCTALRFHTLHEALRLPEDDKTESLQLNLIKLATSDHLKTLATFMKAMTGN